MSILKQPADFIFRVNRGSNFLQNADAYTADYIAAHPRRQQISDFVDGSDVIM
jgi:hypothetical protein